MGWLSAARIPSADEADPVSCRGFSQACPLHLKPLWDFRACPGFRRPASCLALLGGDKAILVQFWSSLAAFERPSPSPDLATPRLGGRTWKKETHGLTLRTSRSARFSWRCSCCLSPSGDLEDLAEAVSSLKFIGKSPSSPKALECLKLCKSTSPRQPVSPGKLILLRAAGRNIAASWQNELSWIEAAKLGGLLCQTACHRVEQGDVQPR